MDEKSIEELNHEYYILNTVFKLEKGRYYKILTKANAQHDQMIKAHKALMEFKNKYGKFLTK